MPTDLPPLMRWESKTRYYAVRVQADLFGDVILSRYWGGKNSHRGGEKHEPLATLEAVKRRLSEIDRDRRRNGYVRCAGN
jgi:predicted DNA-binding WGR domain protein